MERKPNILMIMTDQQRFDTLGCYGSSVVDTPELDRLASEGIRFDQCYVNATICTPSRACIMTGRALPGHGVYKLHDVLPSDQMLFPKLLQEAGYQTALVGKLHVSGRVEEAKRRHPNDGFDRYEWCVDPALHLDSEFNAYAAWLRENRPDFYKRLEREGRKTANIPADSHFTYWAAERTIDFMGERDPDRPFFCMMSLFDPHDPYYDYPVEELAHVRRDRLTWKEDDKALAGEVPDDVRRERGKLKGKPGDAACMEMRAGYYASIAFLDRQIGRVLQRLQELGLEENTLVLFVSDHGDMLGEKGLLMKGGHLYDPTVRVPFLMRFPGRFDVGSVCHALVQPHDIAATLLLVAGCDPDAVSRMMPDSQNLLPIATGESPGRGHAVCLYRNSGYSPEGAYWDPAIHCTMYREGSYKLNVYHSAEPGTLEGELFDLDHDPRELANLWREPLYADVKTRLLLRAMAWLCDQDALYQSGRGGEAITGESKY